MTANMLASTLLVKKRDGQPLSDDEIRFLVDGFCRGEVTDYQMSALAMAICVRGMDRRETATLTHAMLQSGERLPREDFSGDGPPRVDKHSTGGLGDKISLVLAPLLAACELHVPMISGRGLGLSGGTLDKLESIEGFQTELTSQQSSKVLREAGAFIIGASEKIAPADRKLYALRDVTGTVESIPLITASILSKKLAANLDALVMDVKTGSGAFMKTDSEASDLAQSIVDVGDQAGLTTTALLTDMDQPLGESIGNAIEVNEALRVLGGEVGVVRELTLQLCSELLLQIGIDDSREQAMLRLGRLLDDGQAMERFERMINAQGGKMCGQIKLAPRHDVLAPATGYLAGFDCAAIGQTVVMMGGGRRKKGDAIDPSVGIRVHGRIGDTIEKGQPIFSVHCHSRLASDYVSELAQAVEISTGEVKPRPLILKRVRI